MASLELEREAAEPAVHRAVAAVFEALEQAGIDWCLLRGEAELASPTELDLLVSPKHRSIRDVLAPLGFAAVPAWGRGSHRFLVGYDETDGRWIKLDFVSELSFGRSQELQTRAAAGCLARRRRAGPLQVLAPDDAFWSLLLHCLLDKKAVPSHHGERLQELAERAHDDGALAQTVYAVCPPGWDAARALACVRQGDWPSLAAVAPRMRALWARRRPLEVSRRIVVSGVLRRMTKLLTVLHRRGPRVALLGPDGAGKSTLTAGLVETFFFPVRTLYAGLYPTGAKPPRVKLPGLGLAGRLLRLRGASVVARYHQARGRLVIFDRYPYDALLAPLSTLGLAGRLRRRLLVRAAARPDLVVVLDVPAEVSHRRKGEHSLEFLAEQRRRYLELAERIPQADVVDATLGADEVRRAVTSRVWRLYADR